MNEDGGLIICTSLQLHPRPLEIRGKRCKNLIMLLDPMNPLKKIRDWMEEITAQNTGGRGYLMQGGKGPEGLEGSQASHRQRRGVCREGVHVRRSEYLEVSHRAAEVAVH